MVSINMDVVSAVGGRLQQIPGMFHDVTGVDVDGLADAAVSQAVADYALYIYLASVKAGEDLGQLGSGGMQAVVSYHQSEQSVSASMQTLQTSMKVGG